MSEFSEYVFDSAARMEASPSPQALTEVAEEAMRRLGAEVHVGVEVRLLAEGPRVDVVYGRTCAAWEARYQSQGYAVHDPVVRRMLSSPYPVYWSELERSGTALPRAAQRVLSEARDFGLREGFMSPLHHPGGGVSAVLLMGADLDPRDPIRTRAARTLCTAFSEAAHRLRIRKGHEADAGLALTPQQARVVSLVLQGASDKEIGLRLGRSPRTVEHHLRSASAKLGGGSRRQIAQRAHALGLLPLNLEDRRAA